MVGRAQKEKVKDEPGDNGRVKKSIDQGALGES